MDRLAGAALAVLAGVLVSAGCATAGALPAANLTEVQLDRADYRVVATGVTGDAGATYLLGASYSTGPRASTLALVRIGGTGALYREAVNDLWRNFRDEHGEAEGRALALANVNFDADALNLLLVTRQTVTVRADVVEFVSGEDGAGDV